MEPAFLTFYDCRGLPQGSRGNSKTPALVLRFADLFLQVRRKYLADELSTWELAQAASTRPSVTRFGGCLLYFHDEQDRQREAIFKQERIPIYAMSMFILSGCGVLFLFVGFLEALFSVLAWISG